MTDKEKIEFYILQKAISNVQNVVNDAKCSSDFNKGYMTGRYDAIMAIKKILYDVNGGEK